MLDLYGALQNTKGVALDGMDRPSDAIEPITKFLHAQKELCKRSGRQTAKLAAAHSELAKVRLECGQTDGVLKLIEESKRIRRNLDGFDELELFNPLRYEGLYHMICNNLDKAEKCFRQILQARENVFGFDNRESPSPTRYVFRIRKYWIEYLMHSTRRTALTLLKLGDVCCMRGLWEDGVAYHQRAYVFYQKVAGEESISTARAEYKVARNMIKLRTHDSALGR